MIYLALPILNESKYLPDFLHCMRNQKVKDFELFTCVNNYDHWWQDVNLREKCLDNQSSIKILKSFNNIRINIIDKSTQGNGWLKKKGGVGHARKLIMDAISRQANPDDIIISIDADTYYPSDYLTEIRNFFKVNNKIGLSVPYYHKLDHGNERLILRYEVYMRYYLINMFRIKNPWAFTAVGSAMAFPVWAYRKVGGLTPVKSGEDFYFIQKLLKTSTISNWVNTCAYPSSRFSDRVDFGTGPALIKGDTGDWNSYPLYSYKLFDLVRDSFSKFESLYLSDTKTVMDDYLRSQFKTANLWEPLRKNYNDKDNFVKACINKVDALRILQFLKYNHNLNKTNDSKILVEYIKLYHSHDLNENHKRILNDFSFENTSIDDLNIIRDLLYNIENEYRKSNKMP